MSKKNIWLFSLCLAVAALTLGSCKKKAENPAQYDYLAVQMSKGDSWSIVDKNGNEIVKEEYDPDAQISRIYDGVFWVKEGDQFSLFSVDQPKKALINETYTQATDFHAGHAAVANPNKQIQIINTAGKTVATLPKSVKGVYPFNAEGYAVFKGSDNKWGLIDTKGNIVVSASYYWMITPNDGVVVVQPKEDDEDERVIIDMKGKKLGTINLDKYTMETYKYSEDKIFVTTKGDEPHLVALDKSGTKLFDVKKADSAHDYLDGYAVVYKDSKYGLVDDKGELIIRLKYDKLTNLGDGRFAAQKGKEWGVINAKDETLIDFDYSEVACLLGDNYLVIDGSEFSVIGKDGKEVTSFSNATARGTNYYVEYVDVDAIVAELAASITNYEKPRTPAKMAEELSLSEDNHHYQRYIDQYLNIDGKATGEVTTWYEDRVMEEKTHQENVYNGWYTYTRTVSDGFYWSHVRPTRVSSTIRFSGVGMDTKDIYDILCQELRRGRTKIDDGVFSKNINVNGTNIESRTSVTLNGNNIDLNIAFIN